MSKYRELLKALQETKCINCNGSGSVDIGSNVQKCTECHGTGLNAEVSLDIIHRAKPVWFICEDCGDMYNRLEEFKPGTCHHCGSDHISKLLQ